MRRGTTPTICFKIPFQPETISEIWLTLSQRNQEVLTKHKKDMSITEDTASIMLTQEETLLLDDSAPLFIQVRGRLSTNEAFASKIKTVRVDSILKDGII